MGKPFFLLVVAGVVIVVGMLIYPTVHITWATQDTTGWIDMVKGGAIILSYGFIFFMAYAVWKAYKKQG